MDLSTVSSMRPRVASRPQPPSEAPAPLIGDTGNVSVDAIADVVNTTAAPFQSAPDPAKGTLGQVEHGIGAVMGVVGAPFQLLDTGFAMATASIGAAMPGLPAATLMMPHLGTPHTHAHPPSLIPPAPPVPLPSIGTVMLAGCVSVLVGGVPAARAGDVGLAVTCGGLAPAFDIFTGSSNTWIGGSRAARMSDITMHCNPISAMNAVGKAMGAVGVVAGAVSAGAAAAAGAAMAAAAAAAQAAADAAALAMSCLLGKDPGLPPPMGNILMGYPLVLIGGFPMPDVMAVLGGAMKGLKMLGKAIGQSKGFGKALSKVGLCNSPGEPVNPFTGEVFNDFDDYQAPESGFLWGRHYRSGWNDQDGPLGFGHRHFFERKLTLLRKRALYETHDGELVALKRLDDGKFVPVAGFQLTPTASGHLELRTDRGETLLFRPQVGSPPTGRLERYTTPDVDVHLFYDERDRLRALTQFTPGGALDTHLLYDPQGHLTEVHRGVRGQAPAVIARYSYHEGCLVEWQDALGAVTRFQYDAEHRMVRGTDRRGYSFHWHYDPKSGRCIKSYGDDGLWGIEASYEGSQSVFTEPDGAKWLYKFYPDGTISHLVNPDGGVMQYVKDEGGRISKQITPGGSEYLWLYDASGKHYARLDPFGHLVPPEDDEPNPRPLAHDGPITAKDYLWGRPLGQLTPALRYVPAPVATVLAAAQPPAATPPVKYHDAMGRLVEQQEADGSRRRFVRDGEGNVTAEWLQLPAGLATGAAGQAQPLQGAWTQRQYASWNVSVHAPA